MLLSETYFLDTKSDELDFENILKDLTESRLPDIQTALQILEKVKNLLVKESNILQIVSPCTIVGDIHGQFDDILPVIINDQKKFLFLGDYVDRGDKSIELLLYLCVRKILKPDFIHFIKGNHETPGQNEFYGFRSECLEKYDLSFWKKSNELFEYMAICAVVDNKYFCVHGGISPHIKNIMEITFLDRTDYNTYLPLLWSDPSETNGFKASTRGAGYLFGPDKLSEFLDYNNFSNLVRSHQLVMEGYKIMDRCIYVWSAPNYLGTANNIAAVMDIIPDNGFRFELFDCCNYQDVLQ
ncbi:Serine/threonine specific protein phosphatase [Pseudoloma neurophilia]|uniref:Serine/threonine-protein phosphatase n=1 Tax=Pseudoloma neurophilia TaxID=146866 RepID=A0A0R0M1W2_9MICR|nr:Serine/threonine specific protein phosphatase [Pseudoloma neurophilia]